MPDGQQPHKIAELDETQVPGYLRDTYAWAYLSEFGTRFFDRQSIVNAILWGNASRLCRWACKEITAGNHVLQPAAVYGNFSRILAQTVGPTGRLDICDIAPVQVRLTTRKMQDMGQVRVYQHDARKPHPEHYDIIVCFFLLHEVPEQDRENIVHSLLQSVKPSGRCIFIDYHRARPLHPLRPVMSAIFRNLEPYAESMLNTDLQHICPDTKEWSWNKETCFGGLYQKVVACRTREDPAGQAGPTA